jgi:predicted AlkP superfamily phosphohydrolase/phosphomutase
MFEFVGGIQIVDRESVLLDDRQGDEDYERFRNRLMNDLRQLRDPDTKELIISDIYRREELYTGPHTADAPDIIFLMGEHFHGERGLLGSSLVTEVSGNIRLWSGTHRREGLVVLNGPPIRRGKLDSAPAIEHLAPTVLYLLEAGIPEDMDGAIIEEAIRPAFLKEHRARYVPSANGEEKEPGAGSIGLSDEETQKIQKHLENLGYL